MPKTSLSTYRIWHVAYRAFQLLLLLTFVAAPVSLAAAQSQSAGIEINAHAAFDGYFKYSEWLPIWVELENNGADVEAEVQVQIQTSAGNMSYVAPVSLPTTSRKRLPVYIRANNFSREIKVNVVGKDSLLASQTVAVNPQPPIAFLIGLVSPERGALAQLNGIELPGTQRPKFLIDIPLQDLVERQEGLRSFDILVINDTDTSSLTPEQVTAIEGWVRQGGRLVIGGGSGAQKTASGLSEAMLPVQPTTTLELGSVTGLEQFAMGSEIRIPGPFIVATGTILSGKVLAYQEQTPLIVEKNLGSGNIDFVALDLSATPFDAWNGTPSFWETLVGPGAAYPNWLPPDMSARQQLISQMPYALSNLPMLDLPSTQGLAVLLGFYIILVGPVNYLVLRWQKRLHWAWITIPFVTIIFSIGAFSLGYILHGNDLFLNKIAITRLQPDGKAYVDSYMGLFSPAQSAYEIEVQGDVLLSALTDLYYDPWSSQGIPSTQGMSFIQGTQGVVRGLAVNQWSMQSFAAEGLLIDFGKLTTDLRLEGTALVGTARNESDYLVLDAVLILGKRFTRLGDLQPGSEVQVNFDLADFSELRFGPSISYMLFEDQFNSAGPNGPPRAVELKRSILDAVFSQFQYSIPGKNLPSPNTGSGPDPLKNIILLGWLDQAPPETLVAGTHPAEQTTALLYATVGYQIPSGAITLPIGLIPGALTELPSEGGGCGETGTTAVYIGRGQAGFEFYVPVEEQALQIDTLKISIMTDSGWWSAPEIEIYDWETDEWRRLNGVEQGTNLIPNAASMVSPNGVVKLHLISEGNSQGCFYLSLGLEGQRQ